MLTGSCRIKKTLSSTLSIFGNGRAHSVSRRDADRDPQKAHGASQDSSPKGHSSPNERE